MITLANPHDFAGLIGQALAPSGWVLISQATINAFAELTGDRGWYHIDVERAKNELPGGRTIAHGLLTLSLLPELSQQIVCVIAPGRALNYGYDRVRFPAQVPAGSRIRLHMQIVGFEPAGENRLLRRAFTVEVEGNTKPALVTEALSLLLS